MIADNPMSNTGATAVIHTVDPTAIIEVIEGHVKQKPGDYFKFFSFVNIDGVKEEWTLRVHFLFTRELDSERHASIAEHLLDRAWRWYHAYMNWEDQQYEEG